MPRHKLRTLLIVLAIVPMVLALVVTELVLPLAIVAQYFDERPIRKGTVFTPGGGGIVEINVGSETSD